MIDQLRNDVQRRLDQLLAEADRLRQALDALGPGDGAAAPRPRARSKSVSRTVSRTATPAPRPRRAAKSATAVAAPEPGQSQTTAPARSASARTAPGATRSAVLAALAGGTAMTAGEVANATGLGRASVSTTLSKLAKSGEVTKAARGYQVAGHPPTEAESQTTSAA